MHCPSRLTWVNFAKVCYKCLTASPACSLFFLSTSLLMHLVNLVAYYLFSLNIIFILLCLRDTLFYQFQRPYENMEAMSLFFVIFLLVFITGHGNDILLFYKMQVSWILLLVGIL